MGSPVGLLQGARALARDFPRDQMPKGYLWDVADYVPVIIDASLTGRGGWKWGSGVADGDFESGYLAPFVAGEQLLCQTTNGTVYQVDQNPPYPITGRGSCPRSKQNPVMLADTVVSPVGTAPPALWRSGGLTTAYDATGRHAPYAAVYKSMLVTGGAPGEEDVLRFSVPGQALDTAASYDANSFYHSSLKITALAALRSAILIFHAGSVERMRGSTPAHGDTEQGDMFIEPLFDREGCQDPRSIAYWQDNCIFADEHGVHITDGAVIRNLVSQGNILYLWRMAFASKVSLAACTFLDYYLITLRSSAAPPLTLICDLNRRQWFRFTNIDALTFIASSGSSGMERILAGLASHSRLGRIGPCFFPALQTESMVDDDGTPVLPSFETPYYIFGPDGRKRARFVYLRYDLRTDVSVGSDLPADWRVEYGDWEDPPLQLPNGKASRALTPAISVGYITSPQDGAYTNAGTLPSSLDMARFRLPVGKFRYGLAFQVKQLIPSTATRVFELGAEVQGAERSRV